MSFSLGGSTIRSPGSIRETNSTQFAQQRVLSGSVARDYFGSNKRVWELAYSNVLKTDYDTINSVYQTYLSTGNTVAFVSTETNYSISSTNVHVDLQQRDFSVGGSDYISDFILILTEA